ncbi:DEAD/DEAH box helicase [Nocardia seriolae]|uniref:Non-specific serine/threonine protein kinase n=2 Tax=Nocardia seriolae TaxID=37332 RepID=A0ABC8B111_9NOCA|nr:DEAD/DEAH box helicase [Nocardia seriolae]APA99935.1 Non-specific serine/threonine protein kinase [Nocardia seriolae]MTJ72111.1 ATP-dependent helicase [Nocardia seriolae]MTJ89463.1 ATP-dependent helicase [Nocardia seriolae]MTK33439.1 ATP-dependent helicase [Nocardia seriolae]MTK42577.1 ATP-dependent helicase [Nocardia seriolae]
MVALWTWNGHAAGRAPKDLGEVETLALAVPDRDGIGVTDVECALVEPERLCTLPIENPGESIQLLRRAVEADVEERRLPTAAHAVPNATRTAVVSAGRALRALRGTIALHAELRSQLKAELRPYQARGITWLREASAAHGGAVLADEMGLGKTVQAIGYLLGKAGDGPQLVVCPTSLVGNWAHEIERFAPGLRALAWRGGQPPAAEAGTIVVTGYPTLRGHGDALAGQRWAAVVFDEAQVLKNPRTQVARAARAITADARIALTGTPVENHLDELWALLNLVVPQEFTHKAQFRRRFGRPISEGSADAVLRLRDALEPIVLGRRKSQVAASLPAKIHTDLVCDLTDEQERLYDQLLDRAEAAGFGAGAQRHTRVLAVLTELKQVCNHPGLITGELNELPRRSGKFDVCSDILANNLDAGAPTLIFTQYRRTGELLVRHCAEAFGVRVPFFHGGLNPEERGEIVADFQSPHGPAILVLSLRAAGTGLTLTRAADVIHFDRWWNPAVEAQASDRAHRIGQTRTVTVTTLTSGTTIEEHIAGMHERKSALTDLTDAAGIAELARLDDERLMELLRRKRGN